MPSAISRFEKKKKKKAHEPKNTLDPGDDFVTGRVGRLVEVNDTRADIRLDVSLQRRAAIGDRCEVASSDKHCRHKLSVNLSISHVLN